MKRLLKMFGPQWWALSPWCVLLVALIMISRCSGANKEKRRDLLVAVSPQPLQRDTIRDTVEVVTQKVVEVRTVKEALSEEEKKLLKDLKVKLSDVSSMAQTAIETRGTVTLVADTSSQAGQDKGSCDSVLSFSDRWCEFHYNVFKHDLRFTISDSLTTVVAGRYKHRFLWWKWKLTGYELKIVNHNPHSTIKYNSFVKKQ